MIRERALLKHQEKLAAESKAKAETQHTEKKYALKTMMQVRYSQRVQNNRLINALMSRKMFFFLSSYLFTA